MSIERTYDDNCCYGCRFASIKPTDTDSQTFDYTDFISVYCICFHKLVEKTLLDNYKNVKRPDWCSKKSSKL